MRPGDYKNLRIKKKFVAIADCGKMYMDSPQDIRIARFKDTADIWKWADKMVPKPLGIEVAIIVHNLEWVPK